MFVPRRSVARGEQGMTLAEMTIVMLVITLVTTVVGIYGLEWMRRERQRSAVYQIYTQLSLARVEAVTRNRPCRFVIDTAGRTLQVVDLNDLASSADDVPISTLALGAALQLGSPDGVAPVTLQAVDATHFTSTFSDKGAVVSGAGAIRLQTAGDYRRVSVNVGGGISADRWNGTAWIEG